MDSVLRYWMTRPRPLPRRCSVIAPSVSRNGSSDAQRSWFGTMIAAAAASAQTSRAAATRGRPFRMTWTRATVATSAVPPASHAPRLRDSTSAIATTSSAARLTMRPAAGWPRPGARQRRHAHVGHVVAVSLGAARPSRTSRPPVSGRAPRARTEPAPTPRRRRPRPAARAVTVACQAPRRQERHHAPATPRTRARPGSGCRPARAGGAGDQEAGKRAPVRVTPSGVGASNASTPATSGAMATRTPWQREPVIAEPGGRGDASTTAATHAKARIAVAAGARRGSGCSLALTFHAFREDGRRPVGRG